jgi:hypothetical protein
MSVCPPSKSPLGRAQTRVWPPADAPAGPPDVFPAGDALCALAAAHRPLIRLPGHRGNARTPPHALARL